MRKSVYDNQETTGSLGRSAGRSSLLALTAIAILGVSTVSGSLLYQWQQSVTVGETWVDPVAEREAKAALEELGLLVITNPRTGHVEHVDFMQRNDLGDATFQNLAALRRLRTLNLVRSNVTDAQLQYVEGMTDLQGLLLGDTRISDKGLAHLTGLSNLAGLYLVGTEISNEGLRHLDDLRNLWVLDVRNTSVTDEGIRHLRSMDELRNLMLTEITDAGVPHLIEMRSLKQLCVNRNNLTEAKLKQLDKAMPKLTIDCTAAN